MDSVSSVAPCGSATSRHGFDTMRHRRQEGRKLMTPTKKASTKKTATKKTSTKKIATKTAATTGSTACEQYIKANPEILSGFSLTITGKEQAMLRVSSCRGPVRILTYLDDEGGGAQRLIADTQNVTGAWREISLQAFASLTPGKNYVLTWVIDGPADDWQLVSEVTLDATVHYRHLKKRRPDVMNAEALAIKVKP
jgi:hypothetical protein